MIEQHIEHMKDELYNRINSSPWKFIHEFFICNKSYITQPEYDKICNEIYSITYGYVPESFKRVRVHYDFLVDFIEGNISVDRYYTVCTGCHNIFRKPKNLSKICTNCVSKNIKVCDRHNYVHGFMNKYSECLACNIELSHTKHVGADGVDYVQCVICSLRARELTSHYTNIHNITPDTEKYIAICQGKRIGMQGEKNPAYNHGGKYSPYSHHFIKYENLSTDAKHKEIQKIVSTSNETKIKRNSNNTQLEFYLNKGYTNDEAYE